MIDYNISDFITARQTTDSLGRGLATTRSGGVTDYWDLTTLTPMECADEAYDPWDREVTFQVTATIKDILKGTTKVLHKYHLLATRVCSDEKIKDATVDLYCSGKIREMRIKTGRKVVQYRMNGNTYLGNRIFK